MVSGHEGRTEQLLNAPEAGAEQMCGARRRWPKVLVVVLLLCGLFAAGLPLLVGEARDATKCAQCAFTGEQISKALLDYHAQHGSFPPAYIADEDGRPIHSWRALILPYLYGQMNERYSFDEPWDGPNNIKLLDKIWVRCLRDPDGTDSTTSYVAVVGDETMWPHDRGRKLSEVKDDTSNTILIAEVKGVNIPWLEPRDLNFATMDFHINGTAGPAISSHHRGGAMVWKADPALYPPVLGRLQGGGGGPVWLPNSTPPENVRVLLTVAGGEQVETR